MKQLLLVLVLVLPQCIMATTYTLTPSSVSPEPQDEYADDYASITEDVTTLTLTFDEPVYISSTTAAYVTEGISYLYVTMSQEVEGSNTITIDLGDYAIKKDEANGSWYVVIPQGAIGDATAYNSSFSDGNQNAQLVYLYYNEVEYEVGTITISPADGSEVESLSEFTITAEDWEWFYPVEAGVYPYLTNSDGETVATATTKDKYKNYCPITLSETITEPGTYTLVIPEGTYYLQNTSANSNMRKNPDWTYTYTIPSASTGISSVAMESEEGAGTIYSLSGVKVNAGNLSKGVYIQNGRKFVVK